MKPCKDNLTFRYYMAGLIHTYLEKRYNKVLVDISFCNDNAYMFNIRLIDFYLDYFDDNYPSIFFLINVILLTIIFGVLFIVGGFL